MILILTGIKITKYFFIFLMRLQLSLEDTSLYVLEITMHVDHGSTK